MSLPVIILGGGGHGRVVIEALLRAGMPVAGVIDPDGRIAAALPEALPWLGGEDVLAVHPPAAYRLANGVGGIGDGRRRRSFERMKQAGYGFVGVRHPSAVVAETGVTLGEGCQIMAGAVIQPGVRIGANYVINTRVAIDQDCVIGDHCHVAPGAVLCGGVTVGDDTHIGAGAVVIQGVRIGRGCMIGANATILRDVPDGMIVYSAGDRREKPRG